MVAGYTDTSSLWCDGIANSVGIRTSAYVWGSMHCSGGSRHSRQRLRPTVGSPALQAGFAGELPAIKAATSDRSTKCRPRLLRDFQSLTTSTSALSQPTHQTQRDDD